MLNRADAVLLASALVLGLGAAVAFASYRAVNGDGSATADFFENVIWPGVLILAGVAAMVWFGWKANLD
jgi:hypothetical protein